jgi:predicted metal-dependent hydrolase
LTVEDVMVSVVRKRVKNVNLRVYPPAGEVVVSVPLRMPDGVVREVVTGRLPWIRRQRSRYASAPAARFLEFVDGEEHRVFGRSYRLRLEHGRGVTGWPASEPGVIVLRVKPFAEHATRQRAYDAWLRKLLDAEIQRLVTLWAPVLGVEVSAWGVKRMKTRWGTCNHRVRRIWLNFELVKRPRECLEYVVVHELAHIIVPDHSRAFWAVLDRHMPAWRTAKAELDSWPLWADGPVSSSGRASR